MLLHPSYNHRYLESYHQNHHQSLQQNNYRDLHDCVQYTQQHHAAEANVHCVIRGVLPC